MGAWNSRGLNDLGKRRAVMEWASNNHFGVFGLIETRVKPGNMDSASRLFSAKWRLISNHSTSDAARIWLLWDEEQVMIQLISISSQIIYALVTLKCNQQVFYVSMVYGENFELDREALWHDLHQFSSSLSHLGLSLAILILSSRQRKNECNKAFGFDHIECKIDRVLVDHNWLDAFPNSHMHFHNLSVSDHSLMVVTMENIPKKRGQKFYFYNHWVDHDEFLPLVRDVWSQPIDGNPMFILLSKINTLKGVLKNWSRRVFHRLDKKIVETTEEVQALQTMLGSGLIDEGLVSRKRVAGQRLQPLMNARESKLHQRSHIRFLQDGDGNTEFFSSLIDN
ncbi:uncharacterized protein LOC122069134 [Macadamia integrifolia]|uniref:uncharacterized protein LOC122069134 n=1 Tax=Macadamia integrifolia TaxID=60698 RepID=UPI001C4F0CF5|nr:uncharacterized protein LOC122069134 [Macadamia integrifolia]